MRYLIIGSRTLTPDCLFAGGTYEEIPVTFMEKPGKYYRGTIGTHEVLLASRNFHIADVPPHLLDRAAFYRTVLSLSPDAILATSVVGALHRGLNVGDIMVLDQFIDFSHHYRETGFYGTPFRDMTTPFDETLRQMLLHAFRTDKVPVRDTGCYVCVDGPRFETAAEVRAFHILGGDVVGMTLAPEAIFAREHDIPYASMAIVSNYGAGIAPEVDIASINLQSAAGMACISAAVRTALSHV